MPHIVHDFPIDAPAESVFDAIATPIGIERWWTLESAGEGAPGAEWQLRFGPEHDWRAIVRRFEPQRAIEWELTEADPDWIGTRVGLELERRGERTWVRFHHSGWSEDNDHYRTSCFCWAMYLRLLRLWVESGTLVPYADRLDA